MINLGEPGTEVKISEYFGKNVVVIVDPTSTECLQIKITTYEAGMELLDVVSQAIGGLGVNPPIQYMYEETVKLRKTLEDVRGIVEELNVDNQTAYEQGYYDGFTNGVNKATLTVPGAI